MHEARNSLLALLALISLSQLAFSAPVALAAMKGGTNGYLYVPSPTYEPNVTAIKVEEWCGMSPTDCQTNDAGTTKCGCDRLLCDQAGGANPYYSLGGGPVFWGSAQWPNGQIDLGLDSNYISLVGTPEGTNNFPMIPFEYEADCVPDRQISMADITPAWNDVNLTGTYTTDISNIHVVFSTGQDIAVNALGYIDIPAGATSFTVYNGSNTAMALVTFWNSSVQTSKMTQSASPPLSQLVGYPVTFTCNYVDPSNNKIPGANVNVYINGTAYLATETATGYEFNNTFAALGIYSWYCSGTDPTGKYLPASAPPENYEIKLLYCNISWAAAPSAPNDFKTNPDQHFAQVVNHQVTVAVNLTNKNGAAVRNIRATVTPPAVMGAAQLTTPSDNRGIAWVAFTEPATIGKYTVLSASAPICPNGYDVQPPDITSYINAHHDAAYRINVTDPSSKIINLNPGNLYNITIQILDQYGNVCNSSFDGTPYNYTTNPPEYNSTVGINQTYKNSTNTWYYNVPNCSIRSPLECYTIFNASPNTQGIPVGLEGTYTFQMYAYMPDNFTTINNVTDDIEQFDLTYNVNQALDKSNFDASLRVLTGDSVLVVYNQPPTPPDRLRVIAIPHQIKVNDSFNITIQAILPNDSINTTNNAIVEVRRLERRDAPSITNVLINDSCRLVNGVGTFNVTSANSLLYFNVTGVYDIYAFQRANPANNNVNGIGTLIVANGQINHLDIIVDHNGVFRTLPFYATLSVRDAGDNIVTNFTGDVNVSCDPFTTDPAQQNASLTPADQGQTTFTFIANQSGTINCTAHALDPVKNLIVNGTFSVLVVEPDMCTYYSIPPVVPSVPPLDAKIAENITPQIHDVMQQNSVVGPRLIGWDGTKMNGNYSVCLESYHSGRICVKGAEVQYDKAPISVCVKEFIYNPETDAHISDHINYNGTGDLQSTFKHPEIVWGWGYSGSTETYTNCSMDGVDKYSIKLIPPQPPNVHTDFFNVTVTLPLGALEAYNITNDTPLNPHELQAPAAMLVLDERVPVDGTNEGRIAKFDLPVPPSEAALLEEYKDYLAGANAQSMAYDNRGNIYVALTHSEKIMAMKLVKSYPPSLHFAKMVDVITLNGTPFFPYGMDTDSWGNLYVVGNTDPDQPDNMMCINVYNKTLGLIQSNNCCGALDGGGNCVENYYGTVPSITVNEAGSEVYVVRDKKRTCGWSSSIWSCWWTGNPLYYEYNASNVSQSIANVSIFGDSGMGMTLFSSTYSLNGGENITDGACYSDTGGQVVDYGYDNLDGGAHYLRAIKIRKGVMFILDYMSISSNQLWSLCYPSYLLPGCLGCFVPGSWVFPGDCNHCANSVLYENQMTRLLAFDTTNLGGPYKARITVEPNMTVMPLCIVERTIIGPITVCAFGLCGYGLCTNSKSYLTHGMDVDENFDVHIALSGPNNGIAEYRLNQGSVDPSLPGGGWSFDVIYGWVPNTSSIYTSRNLPGLGWTSPAFVTSNVTKPDAVIAYPDLIKMTMMAGVSCEGCSLEGAVEPTVCQKEIGATNQSEYKNINASLAGSNIVPGTPLIRINSSNPPVYRRNSISTNITAFIRFDAYEFDITKIPGGCVGPGGAPSTTIVLKDLNVTAYSNNLERLVEGGGTYFALTRPSYPERPSRTPDTLPYLAYDYYSNRFFYKHFIMMDRMTNAGGNINVMGPPPNEFWYGGATGPNSLLSYPGQWCAMFPDACASPDAKEWILNASYRKSFQTIRNQYYGYEYLATVSTVNKFNENVPVYGVNGYWNSAHQWDPHSDPDAKGSVNPDITATYAPGMIPLNNTVEWSYPFYYNFTPATVMRNPLPFVPDPSDTTTDYTWTAHTNVSALLLSVECVDVVGNPYVLTANLNNLGDSVLAGGQCHEIDGIAITGASGVASVFIQPQDMSPSDGICFEKPGGPNSAECSGTNAWFRQAIQPNTVVTYTTYPPEIPMETRYPLVGEPNGPWPSSLKVLPVNISGPTILTLHGLNSTFNATGNNEFGSLSATANMAGNQLPNPLPINLSNKDLYFRSSANVKFVMTGLGPAGIWPKNINYIIGGWDQIANLGDGVLENISNVQCTDPFGCLFEFSNDSAGAHILGRAYLGQHLSFISSDITTGAVYPDYTYQLARGEVQFVPDDPDIREFMNISYVNGKGYIGDKFNVYTDPDVIINIDNLTASSCGPCTTDADCPGGACDTVNNVCMSGDDCGVARHPSGIPCFPSYVCPRIDLTSLNDTLSVSSDHDHSTHSTTVNIVGTDITPQHNLIKGTALLTGAAGTSVPISGGQYSTVYLIDVINAVKGETLTFSTPLVPDVAGLYVPKANYTTKSSIGSIFPQPRRLRIMSDNPNGESLSYKIVGIRNNDELIEETGTNSTSIECSLTGPANVIKDLVLDSLCAFKIDTVAPQTVGVAFPIRVTAVPTAAVVPPPPSVEKLEYPAFSDAEDVSLCGGSAWDLATKNGVGACFTTQPIPPVIPGHTDVALGYPMGWGFSEAQSLDGFLPGIFFPNDGSAAGIKTSWCLGQFPGVIVYKSAIPSNISKILLRVRTSNEGLHIRVRISNDPNCAAAADPETDFLAADMLNTPAPEYSVKPVGTNNANYVDNILDYTSPAVSGHKWDNIYCIGLYAEHGCTGWCPASCTQQEFWIDAVGVYRDVYTPPVIPPPPPPDSFAVVKFVNPTDIDGFTVTARNLTPTTVNKLTIMASSNPGCLSHNPVADSDPLNWGMTHDVTLIADGTMHDNTDLQPGIFKGALCLAFRETYDTSVKWLIDSVGIDVPQPQAVFPLVAASSVGPSCADPSLMLNAPDGQEACSPQKLYGKFDKSYTLSGFLIYARTDPVTSPTVDLRISNDPSCWNQANSGDFSSFSSYATFHATTPGIDSYVLQNGIVNARCVEAVLSGGNKLYIDAVGVIKVPGQADCSLFSGNAQLGDSGGVCPQTIGPFASGVWNGMVMVPSAGNDDLTVTDYGITGTSNSFPVSVVPGASSASFLTDNQFTHVLAVEINGSAGENFRVTTAPLFLDYPTPDGSDETPEQIGVINVIPNDFAIGFHQNTSGTYIYSQQDLVQVNIPDNNSLGLHNFQFSYYDRFNNTFIVPYTIWLRQPTAIVLNIITNRDSTDLNKTNVNITAQLLYQRFDDPDGKPHVPMSAGYEIRLYVQNSSTTFYGDINQETHPAADPANCNPTAAGVCPNPAIPGLSIEESNCSCPDWWDDPANPGECIPNPNCHQYGVLANEAGGDIFLTNDSGWVNATFSTFGFGRRLMFAVFDGTRDYAPSIQIKPFYAGGLSVAMGQFPLLEPVLLISAALGLITIKRKFNKQKSR